MTSTSPDTYDIAADRVRLVALAFRMLGTRADAEDAVQEAYGRWSALSGAERADIAVPAAWFTRVLGRICLDILGSARVRREEYVGEWLPEPIPAGALGRAAVPDPLDEVERDEAVSMALLVVLEHLTLAERVAFALHDVFAVPFAEIADVLGRTPAAARQLATSAQQRVRSERRRAASRAEHDDAVRAFGAATRAGDLAALVAVLDPSVVLRSDSGGLVSSTRHPVVGADRVAVFLANLLVKQPMDVDEVRTADGLAFRTSRDGVTTGIVNLGVTDGRVAEVWITLHPAKLSAWTGLAPSTDGRVPGAPRVTVHERTPVRHEGPDR